MFDMKTKSKIYELFKGNVTKSFLAEKYGCSPRTIGRIVDEMQKLENTPLKSSSRLLMKIMEDTQSVSRSKQPQPAPVKRAFDESKFSAICSSNSISIFYDGETNVVHKSAMNYEDLKLCLYQGRFEDAWNISTPAKAITEYSSGKIVIKNGVATYAGNEIKNDMVTRVVELMNRGEERYKNIVEFMAKVLRNGSKTAVEGLFKFIEHNDIEINENGNFIAWKVVRSDFKDKHSGRFDNSVGSTPTVPRSSVVEDPKVSCASGLHVCAKHYIKSFYSRGDKIVKVEVDPGDVVSVPYDYSNSKMRLCEYKVIEDVTEVMKPY